MYSYYGMTNKVRLTLGFLRALFRLTLLILLLVPISILAFIMVPPAKFQKKSILRGFFQRIICGLILFIAGIKLKIMGSIPKGPSLLLSNHLGIIEVFVYSYLFKSRIIAKDSLKHIPVLGALLSRLGGIFINRKSLSSMMDVRKCIEDTLDLGNRVLFFPEGTTSHGEGIRLPYTALLSAKMKNNFPVYLCSITAEIPSPHWPLASEVVCWTDGMSIMSHLFRSFFVPSIKIIVNIGPEPIDIVDRKKAAGDIQKGLLDLLFPMAQNPESKRIQWDIPLDPAHEALEIRKRPILLKDSKDSLNTNPKQR